jgi:hypothetical protein
LLALTPCVLVGPHSLCACWPSLLVCLLALTPCVFVW